MRSTITIQWFSTRRGMAGTIVVILVLGYMASISFSQNYLVQAEIQGASARKSSKQAFYAAFAGINFVISQLRSDPTNTYNSVATTKYYSKSTDPAAQYWCSWTGKVASYGSFMATSIVQERAYYCSNLFTQNTDTNPQNYVFYVCSYPGSSTEVYWVKSQGFFNETGSDDTASYSAQLWAELKIDRSGEGVVLKRFGQMNVQTRVLTSGDLVNDFWDWQSF